MLADVVELFVACDVDGYERSSVACLYVSREYVIGTLNASFLSGALRTKEVIRRNVV